MFIENGVITLSQSRQQVLDQHGLRSDPLGIEDNGCHVGGEDRGGNIDRADLSLVGIDRLSVLDDIKHELRRVAPDIEPA